MISSNSSTCSNYSSSGVSSSIVGVSDTIDKFKIVDPSYIPTILIYEGCTPSKALILSMNLVTPSLL